MKKIFLTFIFSLILINTCFAEVSIDNRTLYSNSELENYKNKFLKTVNNYGYPLTKDVNVIILNKSQYKTEIIKLLGDTKQANFIIENTAGLSADDTIYIVVNYNKVNRTLLHELTHQLQLQLLKNKAFLRTEYSEGTAEYLADEILYNKSDSNISKHNYKNRFIYNILYKKDFYDKGKKYGYDEVYEQAAFNMKNYKLEHENIIQTYLRLNKD